MQTAPANLGWQFTHKHYAQFLSEHDSIYTSKFLAEKWGQIMKFQHQIEPNKIIEYCHNDEVKLIVKHKPLRIN